jgi:DnaA family protein
MEQLILGLAEPPAPTLVNFAAGRNAELLHSLRAAAQRRIKAATLFLWGAPGSGRSHLLQGWSGAAREHGAAARYIACENLEGLDADLWSLDCVAVDDVERLAPALQLELFSLCNALREQGGTLVASGSVPPPQLGLRPDLATRLGWGLVYQVHALSDAEKADALREHAAARGIRLTDDVCAFLLARVRRDMGTLLAVLDALDRSSLAAKRAITIPFLREWLQAANNQDRGSRIEDSGSGNRDAEAGTGGSHARIGD